MGVDNSPVTLNKYLYANADPSNFTDPSGHFGLASFSSAQNIQSILRAQGGKKVFTSVFDDAVSASLKLGGRTSGKTVVRLLKQCLKKKDKCGIKMSILIVGSDNNAMKQHIESAQTSSTTVLTYKPNQIGNRSWYRTKSGQAMSGCKFATKGPLDSCDEYPFFKTKQGGAYKLWVSTRWVPAIENSTVGGFFGVIAKVLNKSRNKNFIVATSNSIPTAALPVK